MSKKTVFNVVVGCVGPAEGVDELLREERLVECAMDGSTEPMISASDESRGSKSGDGESIVETEDWRIDRRYPAAPHEQRFQRSECSQHDGSLDEL